MTRFLIYGCVGAALAGFGCFIGLSTIEIFISIILMVILSTILERLLK